MLRIVYALFFLLAFFGFAGASEIKGQHKTICVNMIVKNESSVIKRCLASVLPIVDYWVIVDTGSTDGTQTIIKEFMEMNNIPGELYERPWINFSHNRNEALKLAKDKSDYVLFIDADERLSFGLDFKLPELDKDYYYITTLYGGTSYGRLQLVNNHQDWEWFGVLHEVIWPPADRTFATLAHVNNIPTADGARSKDPQKFQKDAQLLEDALKEDPNNGRYIFYLAQSYRDGGDHAAALKNYERRFHLGGWDQEVYWSLFQIALMKETLGMPKDEVISSYNKAFQYRSSRAEPIYHIANYYRKQGDYQAGYLAAKVGMTIPPSQDILFVQTWMQDYGIPLELSICAYWLGKYDECQQLSLELLKRMDLPDHVAECVKNNLGFANAKLLEQIADRSPPIPTKAL